jgi:pimeloyl-ACP methyl ester carboxylesterase
MHHKRLTMQPRFFVEQHSAHCLSSAREIRLAVKLFHRSIVFLIAGITGSAATDRADSTSELGEQKVDVGEGVSVRVIEAGRAGPARTLVFVPGWSTGADVWRQQIDRFAPTHRVIAFDPRSQGQSTITTSGNTPEIRAQDLHNLLERVDARRPVLIGWSQGVQDLAAYIERYGTHDLAGLVLVDAAVSDGADGMAARPQEAAAQSKMFAVYQADQEEFLRGMMGAIISKPQAGDMIDRLVATGMKTPPSIGIAMLVADLFGVNRTTALKKIDCPTLIIASAKSDELARQQAGAGQVRAGLALHARFEKIEDAGHAVFLDQPVRFDELLEKFVKDLATASAGSRP